MKSAYNKLKADIKEVSTCTEDCDSKLAKLKNRKTFNSDAVGNLDTAEADGERSYTLLGEVRPVVIHKKLDTTKKQVRDVSLYMTLVDSGELRNLGNKPNSTDLAEQLGSYYRGDVADALGTCDANTAIGEFDENEYCDATGVRAVLTSDFLTKNQTSRRRLHSTSDNSPLQNIQFVGTKNTTSRTSFYC